MLRCACAHGDRDAHVTDLQRPGPVLERECRRPGIARLPLRTMRCHLAIGHRVVRRVVDARRPRDRRSTSRTVPRKSEIAPRSSSATSAVSAGDIDRCIDEACRASSASHRWNDRDLVATTNHGRRLGVAPRSRPASGAGGKACHPPTHARAPRTSPTTEPSARSSVSSLRPRRRRRRRRAVLAPSYVLNIRKNARCTSPNTGSKKNAPAFTGALVVCTRNHSGTRGRNRGLQPSRAAPSTA